jgi:hypothetical protein
MCIYNRLQTIYSVATTERNQRLPVLDFTTAMASNPPGKCCFQGVKHEGSSSGEIIKIGEIEVYVRLPDNSSTERGILLYTPDPSLAHCLYNDNGLTFMTIIQADRHLWPPLHQLAADCRPASSQRVFRGHARSFRWRFRCT